MVFDYTNEYDENKPTDTRSPESFIQEPHASKEESAPTKTIFDLDDMTIFTVDRLMMSHLFEPTFLTCNE